MKKKTKKRLCKALFKAVVSIPVLVFLDMILYEMAKLAPWFPALVVGILWICLLILYYFDDEED